MGVHSYGIRCLFVCLFVSNMTSSGRISFVFERSTIFAV